jgi:nucleoside-diphosphate-sugar epimerase
VGALERGFNAKLMLSAEVLSTLANYTWYVSAAKAQRELGWQTRPIEQTFKEVLDYERAKMKK